MSCFLRDGDTVFHTYSTYARGTEMVGGSHYIVDLTVLGRQHQFERALDAELDGGPEAEAR
jgi:predicted dithiol-disulfide oxidoreductase (DUF899 family)